MGFYNLGKTNSQRRACRSVFVVTTGHVRNSTDYYIGEWNTSSRVEHHIKPETSSLTNKPKSTGTTSTTAAAKQDSVSDFRSRCDAAFGNFTTTGVYPSLHCAVQKVLDAAGARLRLGALARTPGASDRVLDPSRPRFFVHGGANIRKLNEILELAALREGVRFEDWDAYARKLKAGMKNSHAPFFVLALRALRWVTSLTR